MATPARDRIQTSKGQAYCLEIKMQELRRVWKGLKSISEELKTLMSENGPMEGAVKEVYSKWLFEYEEFMVLNGEYRELMGGSELEGDYTEWYDERDVFMLNVKSSVESWFASKAEPSITHIPPAKAPSKAGSKSSVRSITSSLRLTEEARERELLEKTKLLEEKQALERKLHMLEMQMKHQTEKHEIEKELAESKGRKEVLEVVEGSSQFLEEQSLVDVEDTLDAGDALLREEYQSRRPATNRKRDDAPANPKGLSEVLVQLQKPKLEIKKFSGDCLTFNKFMRQFKAKIESLCTNDERMAYLEQYTSGEAHQIVVGYSYMDASVGYPAAVKELRRRYGDPEVVAAAYIQKLMNWPTIRADEVKSLDEYALFLRECEAATQCDGDYGVLGFSENLKLIIQKLPFFMHDRWRGIVQNIRKKERRVCFHDLVEFVRAEAVKLNDPVFGRSKLGPGRKPQSEEVKTKVSATTNAGNETFQTKCWKCTGPHTLVNCPQLDTMKLEERQDLVRNLRLCFRCLNKGHMANTCRAAGGNCAECKGQHHTLLHDFTRDRLSAGNTKGGGCSESANQPDPSICANAASRSTCTMPIIPVRVSVGDKDVECYAFLDPGSNESFCTDALAQKLGVHGKKTVLSLKTMGVPCNVTSRVITGLKVEAVSGDGMLVDLPPVFTKSSLPVEEFHIPTKGDIESWDHLKDVDLPKLDNVHDVDLLIGNNVPAAYAPMDFRTGPSGSPFATRTPLGWVAWGVKRDSKGNISSNFIEASGTLEDMFKRSLEYDFPERTVDDRREWSWEDHKFMKKMEESCQRVDGHYEVCLPLRDPHMEMPNNKQMAVKRLSSLAAKFQRLPQFRKDYTDFMEGVISKQYAEVAPEDRTEVGNEWYIPHHGVYHPRKPEKIRVVFDCAAKSRGTALNDVLLSGPNLMNSLQGVLTRFREHPIAFSSDIECMFYQVKVPENQRDMLRFLWWPKGDTSQMPRTYRMSVHLFGAISSPSCAIYSLRKTAEENLTRVGSLAVRTIERNFYMDDALKSTETVEDAIKLVKELKTLCEGGGFNLTKWSSNKREVLQDIPVEDRAKELRDLDLDSSQLPMERTLGVLWNTEVDEFQFQYCIKESKATRRAMLSVMSSTYDPLGFISPLLIPAKSILQEMCRMGTGWDDQPADEMLERWEKWKQNMEELEHVRIPRCFVPDGFGDVVARELHVFADASEVGYGCVIYLRQVNPESEIHCSFVFAKARVTPLKKVTVPRLELTAATLAVRMMAYVQEELDLKIDRVHYWTDSTAVLRYIHNERARYHTFVANRIQVIREASNPSQWHHVGTKDNPADLASRGVKSASVLNGSIWFRGPEYLWKTEDTWPNPIIPLKIEESDPEVKVSCVAACFDELSTTEMLVERVSSWRTLRRVMAWVIRAKKVFLKCIRGEFDDFNDFRGLTPEMLEESETLILKEVQAEFYPEERTALSEGKVVSRQSPLFKHAPMITPDGIIRVGGRLSKSNLPDEQKHPIVLPKSSPVSVLITREAHSKVGHLGKNSILAKLREKYWIYGGGQLAKQVARKCVACRRYQAKPCEQMMADLPANRVKAELPPFTHSGMDYFGPLMVRRGRSEVKRYGVIFTCLSSRAVHLEVAHSLETDACINAIRRFLARRGPIKSIRSDNGTNLVGAEKELRQMLEKVDQTRMTDTLCSGGIEWLFNPPAGSHFGGVWERMIRTTRKILYSLMREQPRTVDDDQLSTVLCEAENILNNRPLTATSPDPDDLTPLTPNMLMNPSAGVLASPGEFDPKDIYARKRWRQAQYLVDVFWSRWRKEYVVTLQQRAKWQRQRRNVLVGDIVLIVDKSVHRNTWPMAVVVSTFKDKKGDVRSCRVRTKTSVLERPVSKLCILVEAQSC